MSVELDWIVGNDTGTSSQTIWAVLMGATPRHRSTPSDPSDFGRCYRLLKLMPAWRARLSEVATRYPEWSALVAHWDELTTLYEQELNTPNGMAPKTYARMKELIDEGLIAAGWKRTGPGSWEGPTHRVTKIGAMTFTGPK